MTLESRVVMLERKINIITTALEIQSMEDMEVSEKTRKGLKKRATDFIKGKKANLVEFRDVLNVL